MVTPLDQALARREPGSPRCDGCAAPWKNEDDAGHWCDSCFVPRLKDALAQAERVREAAKAVLDYENVPSRKALSDLRDALKQAERERDEALDASKMHNAQAGTFLKRAEAAEAELAAVRNERDTLREALREIAHIVWTARRSG